MMLRMPNPRNSDVKLNAPWAMVPLNPNELRRPPEDDAEPPVDTIAHLARAVGSAGA